MSEEEKQDSNGWIEVFRAIKKMHPFVFVFTVVLSFFSKYLKSAQQNL
jgi:hypothetical protein